MGKTEGPGAPRTTLEDRHDSAPAKALYIRKSVAFIGSNGFEHGEELPMSTIGDSGYSAQ